MKNVNQINLSSRGALEQKGDVAMSAPVILTLNGVKGENLGDGSKCRDCHAEFILSEILRSLRFLRMTRNEGLAMTNSKKGVDSHDS